MLEPTWKTLKQINKIINKSKYIYKCKILSIKTGNKLESDLSTRQYFQ